MKSLVINIKNEKHWIKIQNELKKHFKWDVSYRIMIKKDNYEYLNEYNIGISLTTFSTIKEKYKIHLWIKDEYLHTIDGDDTNINEHYCKDIDELLEMYTSHKLGLI